MLGVTLGVILVIAAGWLMLLATGWALPYNLTVSLLEHIRSNPWESLIFALFTSFLGWILLRSAHDQYQKKLTLQTGSGEVRIAQSAVVDLIKRSTTGIAGLKEIKAKVKGSAQGLEIFLTCHVEENFDFTKVSLKTQETVQHAIEQYSGIIVKEVKVLIRPVAIGSHPAWRK